MISGAFGCGNKGVLCTQTCCPGCSYRGFPMQRYAIVASYPCFVCIGIGASIMSVVSMCGAVFYLFFGVYQ